MAYLGFCPPGVVFPYAGSTAPEGWLLCEGQAISRTTYAALFAAIGIAHGYGDNSTTFNLPDYRGRFLRGRDNSAARDPDRAGRTASNTGGNTGDNVGSVQGNATAKNGLSNNASSISALTLNASSISALTLNASSISALTLNASTVTGVQGTNASSNTTNPLAPNPSGQYQDRANQHGAIVGWVAFEWKALKAVQPVDAQGWSYTANSGTAAAQTLSSGTAAAQTLSSGTAAAQTLSSGTAAAQVINNGDNETRPININVNYIIKI